MTYRSTLIAIADDCPAMVPQMPAKPGVAAFQYAMLAGNPYQFTQDEVLFRTHHRNEEGDPDAIRVAHWDEFFRQPRACLRASPLPKKFGWGFHFDSEGKVALLGVDSAEYQRLLADSGVKVVKAMRTKRER